MKILLWGTYDTSKPRIRILRDGLRAQGVEVTEIHVNVWEDVGDKSAMRGAAPWLRRGRRLLGAYPRLVWRYLRTPAHDLVLISYPGQLDTLVLRPFAWLRRNRTVLDWFISAFDTVVEDRKLVSRRHPLAWVLWIGEWLAARAASLAFMDTATHARRMEKLFRLAPGSVASVWVGAESVFFAPPARQPANDRLQILFYGQFIPLHGIETIVEAARLLHDAHVQWTLVGRGQVAPRIRASLAQHPVPNLRWLDWVPYEELVQRITQADVCLGIFGTSEKAASVIPNKVFQVLASGCPLVTRDSPAIRELLADQPPCVQLIQAGDAQALAAAIRNQVGIMHTRAIGDCHTMVRDRITPVAIGRQFITAVTTRFPELSQPHGN
jgi:glycosyltransferase involved in cell wall biosynthesis